MYGRIEREEEGRMRRNWRGLLGALLVALLVWFLFLGPVVRLLRFD